MNKYFLKVFYNRINKKEYDLQIQQYNIYHINIIKIKNIIVVAENSLENKELLVIENVNKITIAKVIKVSSIIDLESKYSWIISNANIDIAKDLGLIGIKKY